MPNPITTIERLVTNLSGQVKRKRLMGRDYLVAPLTLIVPGVLNGSKGPLLYPQTEIEKDPTVWNHMPIVVYHPSVNGTNISARDPEVLENQCVGLVLRASANRKLKAEGWFDIERCQQVDNRVLRALTNGQKIELSTGLFTDNVPVANGSKWNGREYHYVAKNYRPDHLAILPDQVGACSIQDGCGVLVNASSNGVWRTIRGTPVFIQDGKITKGPRALKGKTESQARGKAGKAAQAKAAAAKASKPKTILQDVKDMGFKVSSSEKVAGANKTWLEHHTMSRKEIIEKFDLKNTGTENYPSFEKQTDSYRIALLDRDDADSEYPTIIVERFRKGRYGEMHREGIDTTDFTDNVGWQSISPAIVTHGGAGSGNFGHKGRPGERGGSSDDGGGGGGGKSGRATREDWEKAVTQTGSQIEEGDTVLFEGGLKKKIDVIFKAQQKGYNIIQYEDGSRGGGHISKEYKVLKGSTAGAETETQGIQSLVHERALKAIDSGKVSEEDFSRWNTGAEKARDSDFTVGSKVKISKHYGGGSGYVVGFDSDGSFAMVKKKGEFESYHNTNLKPTSNLAGWVPIVNACGAGDQSSPAKKKKCGCQDPSNCECKPLVTHGGKGSGNFGHKGRPGERGGSGEGEGGRSFANDKAEAEYRDKMKSIHDKMYDEDPVLAKAQMATSYSKDAYDATGDIIGLRSKQVMQSSADAKRYAKSAEEACGRGDYTRGVDYHERASELHDALATSLGRSMGGPQARAAESAHKAASAMHQEAIDEILMHHDMEDVWSENAEWSPVAFTL